MGKFKEKITKKMNDKVAAIAIISAIAITFILAIGTVHYINYSKTAKTNSNLNIEETSKEEKTQDNFETLENVTSQEDLKKLAEEEKKKEEDKEKDEKKDDNTKTSSPKYYIKVNYGAQVVNIYTKDSKGKYTVPVKAMVCSTGTHTPTSGVYTIGYRWEWLEMIGSVYGHYVTQIYGDILFHSVPYLEKGNHSSLEWWAYDQLGTKASLGCVRLTTKDALWMFNNISSGTKVEFYSSSNPGPLGKPSARKISNAPSYVKGWDPTDPDSRNPWPKYLKELENKDDDKTDNDDNNKKPDKNNTVDKNETVDNNETTNNTVNNVTNEITNDVSKDIVNDTINEVENTNILKPEKNDIVDNTLVNETTSV